MHSARTGLESPSQAFSDQLDWDPFLDDFAHEGICDDGANRTGGALRHCLTEIRAGGAKSTFRFDVQGSIAKSTHADLPWLRYATAGWVAQSTLGLA